MLKVYVSCHNYEAFIGDCLASVARQTEAAFSCTVVDDGSTDGSYDRALAAVNGDDRFRVVRQKNAGQLSVFNRAAEEAAPDDCLVLGASLTNPVKGHVDTVTVLYRVHGGNHFHGSDVRGIAEPPAYRIVKERFVLRPTCARFTPPTRARCSPTGSRRCLRDVRERLHEEPAEPLASALVHHLFRH